MEGTGDGDEYLEMSYFCKEFGCLPSELENEDIVILRRVHAARTLQQTLKECGEDIFDRTPEQFKLLVYLKDLREWLVKSKVSSSMD